MDGRQRRRERSRPPLMEKDRAVEAFDEGGEPSCWAQLLCPECGAVVGGDHQGCGSDPKRLGLE